MSHPKADADINAWSHMNWTPGGTSASYRDWGELQHKNKDEDRFGTHININKLDSTVERRVNNATWRESLKNSTGLSHGISRDSQRDFGICSIGYEFNRFEEVLCLLHGFSSLYKGFKGQPFRELMDVVTANIESSVGIAYGPYILKHQKILHKIKEMIIEDEYEETRPLWKILRDEGKCDVLSYIEVEKLLVSPLEWARRARSYKVFHQRYVKNNWIDVLFLREMRDARSLMFSPSKKSAPLLRDLINTEYTTVRKYVNNLHRRNPLFNKCLAYKKGTKKYFEQYLYHIQYQTRRNMITILKSVHFLREIGNLDRLLAYVERVLSAYIPLKTHRVMPWKFEFLNDLINILGFAFTDKLNIPPNIDRWPNSYRILILLELPIETKTIAKTVVFGDKSTFTDIEKEADDPKAAVFRRAISSMEQRIQFSKYPIERVYILHECARKHFQNGNLDESRHYARKGFEEAKLCNSNLWEFLCALLILKTDAIIGKLERSEVVLVQLVHLATRLKNQRIYDYVYALQRYNRMELDAKQTNMRDHKSTKGSKLFIKGRGVSFNHPSSHHV